MPCASIAAWCSGLARTARSPPWTPGWRVLTRPSIISGKPVRSDTSSTTRPASASARRVPPVETRATPRSASARAKGRRPVLSDTERSARVTRFRSLGIAAPEGGAGKRRDITKAAGAKRDYLSPRRGERPTRRSRAGEGLSTAERERRQPLTLRNKSGGLASRLSTAKPFPATRGEVGGAASKIAGEALHLPVVVAGRLEAAAAAVLLGSCALGRAGVDGPAALRRLGKRPARRRRKRFSRRRGFGPIVRPRPGGGLVVGHRHFPHKAREARASLGATWSRR